MESTKWLLIENKGHIDVNALILMGGSTKRDSTSSIGMFGSGNKYSLALLLKNGIEFKIFSGTTEIVVSTKDVEFRDKSFKQILIDGNPTSLTTDMGPQWNSWMAIREFVANSLDEGESNVVMGTESVNGREGYTRIYVEQCEALSDVITNWDKYFSFDRTDALVDNEYGKIFPNLDPEQEQLILYRKGIQCYEGKGRKSFYYYDLPVFEINETRVISSDWTMRRQIRNFLADYATKEVARNILGNAFSEQSYFEAELSYEDNGSLAESWKEAVGDYVIVNKSASGFYLKEIDASNGHYYVVSRGLAKAIKRSFPEIPVYGVGQDEDSQINWRVIEKPGSKIDYLLKESLDFLKETMFPIGYPISVVEFDKMETLGLAVRSTQEILLSSKLFDMGRKEIVMTLIEEHLHLHDGLEDETRKFQNHLIRLLVSEKEERFGIFL